MEKKRVRFNLVDIIAVVLIVAVLAFVGYKMVKRAGASSGGGEGATITVTYAVKATAVDATLFDTVQKHLPSQLMASGNLYNGQILSVRQEPALVLSADGTWVEDPSRVDLYFDVEATIPKTEVLTTEIAKQEVRVGKNDYFLKSQFVEFKDCVILDANWAE